MKKMIRMLSIVLISAMLTELSPVSVLAANGDAVGTYAEETTDILWDEEEAAEPDGDLPDSIPEEEIQSGADEPWEAPFERREDEEAEAEDASYPLLKDLDSGVLDDEVPDEGTVDEKMQEYGEEGTEALHVLYEEESLRDASSKHFKLNNGTYLAVQYDTIIHTKMKTGNGRI